MITTYLFIVAALVLMAAAFWLVGKPIAAQPPKTLPRSARVEELIPRHWRHFPQVRHALSESDQEYLRRRAPRQVFERWQAERRQIARQYLAALREDFERLTELARSVASLSPQVSRQREAELLWLGVKFRVLYAAAGLQLAAGAVSVPQLERLAEVLSGLSGRVEAAMATMAEASLGRLRSSVSG